jgi:lipoic acid synthetase
MLRVRWLGRVSYADAQALQEALHADRGGDGYLLLLEHPHVYTLGVRGTVDDVLVDPASVGATAVRTNRGGQVTYHGPGQLVGYPILDVAGGPGAVPRHMAVIEDVVIDALAALGLPGCGRLDLPGHEGVWVDPTGPRPRKICAVGARVTRGRSMHGFALNVDPDLGMFDHIVPCGITDKPVTSLAAEGIAAEMNDVVDAVVAAATARWAAGARVDRRDVVVAVPAADLAAFTRGEGPGTPIRLRRLEQAGVDTATAVTLTDRKPAWMQVRLHHGPEVLELKRTIRDLDLTTVCEEAGCPNLSECWSEGTATFMVLGERCTRACGFCLVDTRRPLAPDAEEPARVAEAVRRMGLAHAVVTMVARDDLADGGAAHVVATIDAIRAANPDCRVEVLISDMKGDPGSLATVADARPDVWNHNVETVLRLQRAVRPSASYARSLAVLARGKAAGLTTKTSIIVGLGERDDEVLSTLADLAALSVDIVTIGQYLRPTTNHLPIDRWWHPDELTRLKLAGEGMGIPHVEASPLTRSSYHARGAADAAAAARSGVAVALGGRRP